MRKSSLTLRCFLLALVLLLTACASSKVATQNTQVKQPATPVVKDSSAQVPEVEGNPDVAQEAFLRYLYLINLEEKEIAFEFLKKAAEAEPGNRYLAFTLAEAFAEKELFSEALSVAEPAKKMKGTPNSAEYGLLATLYMRTGNADSAKAYYKLAIQENEEDYVKLYEYSLFLEWHQPIDTKELMRVYGALLPRLNYMRPMFGRLAQLYLEEKQDSLFLNLLENAFVATKNKEFMFDKIKYFESNKMKDSVNSVADRLYKALPTDSGVVFFQASRMMEQEKFAEGEKVIDSYISEKGDSAMVPLVIFYKGLFSRLLGKLDSSQVYFSKLVTDTSLASRAYANLSLISSSHQDTSKAIHYMEMADSLEPETFWKDRLFMYMTYEKTEKLYRYLESLLVKQKANYEQQKASEEVTDLNSHPYLTMLIFAAQLYSGQAQKLVYSAPDSSVKLYTKALESVNAYLALDSLSEQMLFYQAAYLERLKRDDEAVAKFREILKRLPTDHHTMNFLGYTLIDRNKSLEEVKEGMVFVEAALSFDPKNASYLDSKAWGFYRLGNYEEALKILREAVAYDERFLEEFDYWDHLGLVLEALGDKEMALECFIKLGEIEPKHPRAKFPSKKKP